VPDTEAAIGDDRGDARREGVGVDCLLTAMAPFHWPVSCVLCRVCAKCQVDRVEEEEEEGDEEVVVEEEEEEGEEEEDDKNEEAGKGLEEEEEEEEEEEDDEEEEACCAVVALSAVTILSHSWSPPSLPSMLGSSPSSPSSWSCVRASSWVCCVKPPPPWASS